MLNVIFHFCNKKNAEFCCNMTNRQQLGTNPLTNQPTMCMCFIVGEIFEHINLNVSFNLVIERALEIK
jgi:hypothetical protein